MSDEQVELPHGDPARLVETLAGARFANLVPGADAEPGRAHSPLSNLYRSRGPVLPLATWTPTEIGIQHATGPKALPRLAEAGCPLPEGWVRVEDHPRYGLVVRPARDAALADVIAWLMAATEALCPLEITGPWRAVVRR